MKNIKKILALLIFLVSLNAVSVNAQDSQQDAGKNAVKQLGIEYQQEFMNLSDLAPIRPKIPIVTRLATLEQLSDATKPNKSEKKALEAYSQLRKKFEIKDMELTNKYWPYIIPARRTFHRNLEEVLTELYVGKITFGQFNKRRKEISDEFQSRVDALNSERRLNRDIAQQNNQRNSQKEATCTRLRAQLQQKIEAQDSWTNRIADAQAWTSGGVNGPTAALSARASQKAQEQEQVNQLQQYIINYCGGL